MRVKNQEQWAKAVAANADSYGTGIFSYAKQWAQLMEAEMANGKTIPEVAKETSHEADTEGITGFMYGAAVSVLATFWEHGEELRIWHNLATQIGNEGERANKVPGRTLNAAMLNVK